MEHPVLLGELGPHDVEYRIDDDVAEAIRTTQLVRLTRVGEARYLVSPNGRVGSVMVGGRLVQVAPKIAGARVVFLLAYASSPGFRPEDVPSLEEPDLVPALAESLARQAEQALQRGILQGYVTVHDALSVVRGRILVAEQMARRPGMLLPVELRFDEYEVDIPENRILRSALRRLQALPLREDVRRRIAHLDARLDGVTVLAPGSRSPTWRRSRLNERYGAALALAEIVLRDAAVEAHATGGRAMSGFVVNMAKAFEDFLTASITDALRGHAGATIPQKPLRLDVDDGSGRPRLSCFPDVAHQIGDRVVAVMDAKYKAERDGRFPIDDVYQMLAYCTALSLRRGWLVYAKGFGPEDTRSIAGAEIDVARVCVDVDQRPRNVLADVRRLAEEIALYGGFSSTAGLGRVSGRAG